MLLKSYGLRLQYTVPQIEKAAMKCGASMNHISYAIALYRHEESNRTLRLYHIDQESLNTLRREISDTYFDGYDYRVKDVINLAKPKAWRGGHIRSMAHRYGKTATY